MRDFRYHDSNRTRGLFVGKLDWPEGGRPRLVGPGRSSLSNA